MKKYSSIVMILLTAVCSGCSRTATRIEHTSPPVVASRQEPGVVQGIWEEPMVDVVDVPPGLDPEGHYYRPGHQEVIEIRQGRWKYYPNGEEKGR